MFCSWFCVQFDLNPHGDASTTICSIGLEKVEKEWTEAVTWKTPQKHNLCYYAYIVISSIDWLTIVYDHKENLLQLRGGMIVASRTIRKYISHLSFLFHLQLTHEGSHREGLPGCPTQLKNLLKACCQGLCKPQALRTPSLNCPIGNSASTLSQQPV